MPNRMSQHTALFLFATLFCANAMAQLPIIPGAAGFGMETSAGRGGRIIRVTNLNDSGLGSLRSCVQTSGPRICIFEVSGSIRLKSYLTVSNPNLTVAGQTAPEPGIMLRGASFAIHASDVLIQHLALRAGDDQDGVRWASRDSLKIAGNKRGVSVRNVVIDHCSLSWSIDELVEVVGEWDDVTLSNNIFSEPLRLHGNGAGGWAKHGYSALIDATDGKISLIGNLFAHGYNRNPKSGAANFVFVNNIVYNAGASALSLVNEEEVTKNSIVGNIFIKGRDSDGMPPIKLAGSHQNADGSIRTLLRGTGIYLFDNVAADEISDPWSIVLNLSGVDLNDLQLSRAPLWPSGLKPLPTANDVARTYVLANAGSRPAQRGVVDARIVADVKQGTGQIISCVSNDHTSKCAKNAGGWPVFAENSRRLSVPSDPNGDDDRDGYSNVDEWLHAMSAEVEGRRSSSVDPTASAPPRPPELQSP